jgi:hypothetical protein
MKKIIKIISAVVTGFSVLLLVYGCIKLARVEAAQPIDSGSDDIRIEQPEPLINKDVAQIIIGVSVVTLVLGGVGFTLSSQKRVS